MKRLISIFLLLSMVGLAYGQQNLRTDGRYPGTNLTLKGVTHLERAVSSNSYPFLTEFDLPNVSMPGMQPDTLYFSTLTPPSAATLNNFLRVYDSGPNFFEGENFILTNVSGLTITIYYLDDGIDTVALTNWVPNEVMSEGSSVGDGMVRYSSVMINPGYYLATTNLTRSPVSLPIPWILFSSDEEGYHAVTHFAGYKSGVLDTTFSGSIGYDAEVEGVAYKDKNGVRQMVVSDEGVSGNRSDFVNIYVPSNSPAAWPTAARFPGDAYVANSNGYIYLLTSQTGGTAWTKTNFLRGPVTMNQPAALDGAPATGPNIANTFTSGAGDWLKSDGAKGNPTQYATNTVGTTPTFAFKEGWAFHDLTTNATFQFLPPAGVSATNYQTCVMLVSNSSASIIDVIAPANCYTNTDGIPWNVTNGGLTRFTFFCNAGRWTNAIAAPIK